MAEQGRDRHGGVKQEGDGFANGKIQEPRQELFSGKLERFIRLRRHGENNELSLYKPTLKLREGRLC